MKARPRDWGTRPLPVLHAEGSFVVVDKPADILAVPGRGPELADCVVARVRQAFPQATGSLAAHRLDMETSGLMILGLTPAAHRELSRQFEERRVHKEYVAIVEGRVEGDAGRIELTTRVDLDDRPRQIVDDEHGKMGLTEWRVIERMSTTTRLLFTPQTGRTHQLRVHAAHERGLGHPIVGDRLYGTPGERLLLHASRLDVDHPVTGQRLRFDLPAPF